MAEAKSVLKLGILLSQRPEGCHTTGTGHMLTLIMFCCFAFKTESFYVAHADLNFPAIFLPSFDKC